MTNSNIKYLLALSSVKRLGNKRIKRLIEDFENGEAVFGADPTEIQKILSISLDLAKQIGTVADDFPMFQERLEVLRDQHIQVLSLEDTNYPARLKMLDDPPAILCRVGNLTEMNESCVAIVGTRKLAREASQLTYELAIELTKAGFTIVSGLAKGIDTCAHKGALECPGKTIAVMATDALNVYPSENRKLAEDIRSNGCLLSEHPFPASATPRNLVQRNRITSGLSIATIVIQAGAESGTMHTARFAKEQKRPVFACQWEDDSKSLGTRMLLKDGAIPFIPNKIDDVVKRLKEITKDTAIHAAVDRKSTQEQLGDYVQTKLALKDFESEKPTQNTNQEAAIEQNQ